VPGITRVWTDRRIRWPIVVGLVAFVVYEISREPGPQVYNQYVRLANGLLHGRLHIADAEPWLELVTYKGRRYSHQGVLPAILLMPFVVIFGPDFNLRHFAALLGGGISVTAWSLATRIGLSGRERLLGWAFPVVGTTIWYEAKTGHTWGVAALASVLFLFLSVHEYFGPRRLWLVGLFVGLAALSRPPAIFALIGFAVAVRNPRKIVQLGLGALGPVVVMLTYNYLRFAALLDRAQELHYQQDGFRKLRPPGQFSLAHLPFNLYSWFILGPQFQNAFPYLRPTSLGTSLTLTSPAFITAFGARVERWLWLAALCVVGPAALHYANGFSQFGMRYLLDAIPFLSTLIFLALRDNRAAGYSVLLGASIAFNAYGVAYTNVFGLRG
jgi:hypothetical protein